MFMDDDDEFGELYSDILPPQAVSSPNPNPNFAAVAASSTNPNSKLSFVSASSTNPVPDFPCVLAVSTNHSPNLSSVNARISAQNPNSKICSSDALDDLIHGEPNDDWMPDNWDDDEILEENSNVQPESKEKNVIPAAIQGEDWDSDDDSEDDLKIVLNDDPIERVETDEVENEDNLMAYDNNESNQDRIQVINDGDLERNEDSLENTVGLDGSKANEAVKNGVGIFGQQQQQQSMFKYVRPGATVVDVPGQIRPLGQTVGPISHGRGEWRSGFVPKSFGSGWANNASRPFGGGLDFTLPSYKTIFDFDIEVFEEKRWRHPGADISDYFNFGLNEESWKVYARQVDQLRIESTMQSKIRVHESDRSKQEYDPDLPPELAAAAGNHNISANILNSGRIDNGQPDLNGQGRGSPYTLPVGRPIQVETGNGERMPFAETRPPRPRDPDVIIEVFPDDHLVDDTTAHDNASELPDKDLQGEKCNSIDDADYGHSDSDYDSHSPRYFNGSKRENFNDRYPENDLFSTPRGRSADRPSHRRHESASEENKDCQKETRENSMAANESPNQSPAKTVSAKWEPSTELADDTEDKLVLDDNTVMEDEGTSDSITRSSKSHKLSSRIVPTNRDDVDKEGDDLGNIPSETSLQDGRWRNGNMRRYTNEYVRERRNEMMDRKRISSRAYQTMPYPNRVWEQPYPVRPVRGPERLKESDTFWRERKTMVNERNDKDDGFKIRERSSRVHEWKDEDYHKREKAEKGEIDRRRREKDKKVEDQYHNSRHKDDSYREREVEDKHRLDRRSRRAVEKDDNQFIDKRQQKENEDYHSHEKRSSNKERSSRIHNSRPIDFDKTSKETHKESTRKNKDYGTQYSSSHNKRKHEDNTKDPEASAKYSSSHSKRKHEDNANREKASSKQIDGQQKEEKDNLRHEDENDTNRESKRGRSKVERWSSDIKEVDIPTNDDIITSINEPTKPGGNSDASHPDGHLDPETLEKLKRRRERFKTPLTSEKDTPSSKKLEKNDLRLNLNETHAEESEVKHERPPRKRRWTSN